MSNFLIGVATSSHQNEGNNFQNNWWDWEISENLERSGIATNSWIEYKRDIDAVKSLGCNAYRFSIEWSRIFLDEYKVDKNALKRYEDMVDYCRSKEIEPVVTLHHFTRPRWFDDKYGGLHNKHIVRFFQNYVEVLMQSFGKKVKYWITFNEPMLECVHGYLRATRPPGHKGDFDNMYKAMGNLIDSHCVAYDIIKKWNKSAMVGITKNLIDFELRYNYDLLKATIEKQVIQNHNWGILDALYRGHLQYGITVGGIGINKSEKNDYWKGKIDFLGINHYNVAYVEIVYRTYDQIDVKTTKEDTPYITNHLDWDIKPGSMKNTLDMIRLRYGNVKVMITESGSCDSKREDGKMKEHVMDTHMREVMEWQKKNGGVLGYLWWTLVDNYEWEDGYGPKFGLFYLDKGMWTKKCGEKFKKRVEESFHYLKS